MSFVLVHLRVNKHQFREALEPCKFSTNSSQDAFAKPGQPAGNRSPGVSVGSSPFSVVALLYFQRLRRVPGPLPVPALLSRKTWAGFLLQGAASLLPSSRLPLSLLGIKLSVVSSPLSSRLLSDLILSCHVADQRQLGALICTKKPLYSDMLMYRLPATFIFLGPLLPVLSTFIHSPCPLPLPMLSVSSPPKTL